MMIHSWEHRIDCRGHNDLLLFQLLWLYVWKHTAMAWLPPQSRLKKLIFWISAYQIPKDTLWHTPGCTTSLFQNFSQIVVRKKHQTLCNSLPALMFLQICCHLLLSAMCRTNLLSVVALVLIDVENKTKMSSHRSAFQTCQHSHDS